MEGKRRRTGWVWEGKEETVVFDPELRPKGG
jgi:hypothetical protein